MTRGEGREPCPRDKRVCRGTILPTMLRLVTQVAGPRKGDYAFDGRERPAASCAMVQRITHSGLMQEFSI
jgi:hypothetical protein